MNRLDRVRLPGILLLLYNTNNPEGKKENEIENDKLKNCTEVRFRMRERQTMTFSRLTYCLQPSSGVSRELQPGSLITSTQAGPLVNFFPMSSTSHLDPPSNHKLPPSRAYNEAVDLWTCGSRDTERDA